MSHTQVFLSADNAEGYVSVIVHRERYLETLKQMGWVESEEDLKKEDEPARDDIVKQCNELDIEVGNKKNKTLLKEIEAKLAQ